MDAGSTIRKPQPQRMAGDRRGGVDAAVSVALAPWYKLFGDAAGGAVDCGPGWADEQGFGALQGDLVATELLHQIQAEIERGVHAAAAVEAAVLQRTAPWR